MTQMSRQHRHAGGDRHAGMNYLVSLPRRIVTV